MYVINCRLKKHLLKKCMELVKNKNSFNICFHESVNHIF